MKTNIHLRMRNVSDKNCGENQNAHFSFNTFFLNRAFYESMWKSMVEEQATDDNTMRRMRFACWVTKTTDTHTECVICVAFPRQQ